MAALDRAAAMASEREALETDDDGRERARTLGGAARQYRLMFGDGG